MRRRTKARECALKILYAIDITKDPERKCIDNFWESHPDIENDVKSFTEELVEGVAKNKDYIDQTISKYATNWQIQRMATIDRNILRMSTFELIFAEDIPPKVSINEAVEIAKKYGDRDSGKFVNGILDKINKTFPQKTDG